MKKFVIVLFFLNIFLPWQLALANDPAIPRVYEIFAEQNSTADAGGVRFKSDFTDEPNVLLGSSFSRINSSTRDLAKGNRKTIFPVYIFIQFKPELFINPYFEAGADVGDLLTRNFNQNTDNGTNPEPAEPVDTYFALGIEFKHKHFGISAYYKEYDLEYWNSVNSTTYVRQINILKMTGLSLSYNF